MSKRLRRWSKLVCVAVCAASILLCGCGTDIEAEKEYRTYGIACLEKGDYEGAIEAFQKALDESVGELSELDLDICYYKAEAQYCSGAYVDALETYTAIIDHSGDAEAYYLRGCLYYATGVENEAGQGVADFEAALEAEPDNYEIYIGIYEMLSSVEITDGISMVSMNLTDEEIEDYLYQALKIKGTSAKDYMYKGRICYMLEEYNDALSYLEKAVEKGNSEAYYYLVQVYEALGDSDSANEIFEEYINSDEMDAQGLYDIGVARMENEKYEDALACFQLGLAQEKCDCEQELRKGMIVAYEYLGEFDTAMEWLEDYLVDYPDDEDMQKEYTFLLTR